MLSWLINHHTFINILSKTYRLQFLLKKQEFSIKFLKSYTSIGFDSWIKWLNDMVHDWLKVGKEVKSNFRTIYFTSIEKY